MKHLSLIAVALTALLFPTLPVLADAVEKPVPLGAELTKKSPFSMVGQLIFRSGESYFGGSGTVVHSRSVLTAAHNLWDATNGWSTEVQFNRARNGTGSASKQTASRMFVFGSYRSAAARYGVDSVHSFASDLGGIRFTAMPAGGAYVGWRADAGLLGPGAPMLCMGYGAEFHSGNELLVARSAAGFASVTGAFMENTSMTFESGMSGGPVFAEVAPGDLRVVGIVVAGSDNPPACGIHALDAAGAGFITTYLRY